ncbi:MAG: hypothetical protein ACXW1B_01690 [Nitrososphaeraceae archaeon]
MSSISNIFMITFLEELVFHFNDRTTITEEEKQIFIYFLQKISMGEGYSTLKVLVFKNNNIKHILSWAYDVFLRLLYDYEDSEDLSFGKDKKTTFTMLNYREIVNSKSFNNLLFSLNHSSKVSSKVITSHICIDFASLVQIFGGNFLTHEGGDGCWNEKFVYQLPGWYYSKKFV